MRKTVFVDDLTGEEASTSLSFGLDDEMYEIDLNDENARELRETLEKYVRVARRKMMEQQPRTNERQSSSDRNSKEIRKWAKKQGYAIKGFGRIPAKIVQEWENAQSGRGSDNESPRRRMEDQQRERALSRSQQQRSNDDEWEAA